MLERLESMCFGNSGLEEFRAPASLRMIGVEAFSGCESLKRVVLNEGLVELITESGQYDENGNLTMYNGIFGQSGLEEIVLPGTLREIRGPVFDGCSNLKVVWVGGKCTVNIRANVAESVEIQSADKVRLGDYLIWDLQKLKEIVIPDGTEKI